MKLTSLIVPSVPEPEIPDKATSVAPGPVAVSELLLIVTVLICPGLEEPGGPGAPNAVVRAIASASVPSVVTVLPLINTDVVVLP